MDRKLNALQRFANFFHILTAFFGYFNRFTHFNINNIAVLLGIGGNPGKLCCVFGNFIDRNRKLVYR